MFLAVVTAHHIRTRIPSGCHFRTRCRYAQAKCADKTPEWRELAKDHWVACHFADQPNFGLGQ